MTQLSQEPAARSLPDPLLRIPSSRHARASQPLMAVALAMVLTMAGGAQEALPPIPTEEPAGLTEAANQLRSAVFFTIGAAGRKVFGDTGFFISADGLALYRLDPLCADPPPIFRTAEIRGGGLKPPVVLEVFPDQALALLKFDHRPRAWLTITRETPSIGTWVAVVPSGFTGGGPLPEAVAGPIVAHRITSGSVTHPPRPSPKQFSIAMGKNPSYEPTLTSGAPVINERGEVVAAFSGSQPMPGQTLRLANPLAGFPEQIDEAVKKGNRRKLPLAIGESGLDPALFSNTCRLMGGSAMAGDLAQERSLARKLLEEFPDSRFVKSHEFGVAAQQVIAGSSNPDELLDLAQRSKPPASANAADQAAYQERLGQALVHAGRTEEAIDALRKSHELDPWALACMTLAVIHERRRELEKAEECWRQATMMNPERIDYWDRYQGVLAAREKWKEADAAQDRVYLLESLYRSR
jgi:tetratricopeptide (TPR) repeat protein